MKPFYILALLGCAVIGASTITGVVRANEMAEETVEQVQADASTQADAPMYQEISAEELQVLIDTRKELVIVDARLESEFSQGHIPGAVALRPADATPERLAQLTDDKGAPMVFYCGNVECTASAKAAHRAAEEGYSQLYKYPGGIEDWKAKGMPVATN
jgi:thiosulfate/3-mercaptopyruvate sulfurtransferase